MSKRSALVDSNSELLLENDMSDKQKVDTDQVTDKNNSGPVTSPSPFDLEKFAVSGTVMGEIGAEKMLVNVPVRKPNRQEFVRTHEGTDHRLRASILELKEEREIYLMTPELAMALPGETRLVMLRLCANRQGAIFLWPVPEPNIDGRTLAWHTTSRNAAGMAEKDWIRIVANMSQGCYDIFKAPGTLGNPVWPDKSFEDILAIAFGDSYIIDDPAHPVIKRLLGYS